MEKLGNSLQIRCNTTESCFCKWGEPTTFSAPSNNSKCADVLDTHNQHIFSMSSSTTLGSRGCPVTHWAPALLTGSKRSGLQEGTIYRVHPTALPAKAGLCHSVQLCPKGRSCPDKESWTSLPCASVFVSGNFTFPSRVSGSTLTALSDVKLSQAGTYVWDDPRHFFPYLSCQFQNRFLTALESNFFFVHDLHFRGSTWTKVLTFSITFDWSHEKKEHLVNITYL